MTDGKLYFEDFPVGTVKRASGYHVSEEEIISFAKQFDPQPMHLDPVAAQATMMKGLAAPGMLTCSIVMRMTFDAFLFHAVGLGAPGIDKNNWLKPVRPGMDLNLEVKVVGARVSQSRPEMGLLTFDIALRDQTQELLLTQYYTAFYQRRDTTPPPPEAPAPRAPKVQEPELPRFDDERVNLTRFASRFDDVTVGARIECGSVRFTHDDIVRFAQKYDPQPFHLSDEGASHSHFGKLASSGWLTAANYVRLFVEARNRARARGKELGLDLNPGRPSPGYRNLRWIRPVYVDDVLTYDTTVIAKEPNFRPGLGLLRHRATGTNQKGERVFSIEGSSLLSMD